MCYLLWNLRWKLSLKLWQARLGVILLLCARRLQVWSCASTAGARHSLRSAWQLVVRPSNFESFLILNPPARRPYSSTSDVQMPQLQMPPAQLQMPMTHRRAREEGGRKERRLMRLKSASLWVSQLR